MKFLEESKQELLGEIPGDIPSRIVKKKINKNFVRTTGGISGRIYGNFWRNLRRKSERNSINNYWLDPCINFWNISNRSISSRNNWKNSSRICRKNHRRCPWYSTPLRSSNVKNLDKNLK